MNTDPKMISAAEPVTIDDVAVLALKIGKEIWGKEQFIKMMESTELAVTPAAISNTVDNQSFKPIPLKPQQKKESA